MQQSYQLRKNGEYEFYVYVLYYFFMGGLHQQNTKKTVRKSFTCSKTLYRRLVSMHLNRNGFIEITATELTVLNEYSRDTEEGPKSVAQ